MQSKKDSIRRRTKYLVKIGVLVKPNVCSECGQEKPLQTHHKDYTNAVDIVWVCRSCHWEIYHPKAMRECSMAEALDEYTRFYETHSNLYSY